MNFQPIEGPRLKVVTVDHKHPVKMSNKPAKKKANKTQLPAGGGNHKVDQEVSDDGRYLIMRPRRKWKTFRRTDNDAPAGPGKFFAWELIGGAEIREQAIQCAIEDSAC